MRTPALGCTLLTVLVFLCSQLVRVQAENSELHCTQTIFDPKGGVYVEATLTACVGLMAAPTMPVSYNILYVGNLTVSNQISLNNIINVNEVDSVIEIDFYYRQSWIDPRWVMTDEFWAGVDPRLPSTGMDIFPMYQGDHREDPMPVWVPDAWFQDVMDLQIQARLTLKQAHMDLTLYPLDYQLIDLKLLSYGLTAQHMKMVYKDPPIEYLLDHDGNANFANNAIWEHKEGYYNASTKTDNFLINGYLKTYETLHMKIYIQRQGTGVLMRFAMPILILLLLAGATFWANFETRIDTSMTILLAVSALYVVILGSIPQVGYLTDFDIWIFNMFIMLAACVFAHQLVVNSFRKVDQWPFRGVVIRLIELLGRVFIIPLCLVMFNDTFKGDEVDVFNKPYVKLPLFFAFALLMVREAFGVKKAILNGMVLIGEKISEGKRKISWWELFILNLVTFKVFDLTTAPYKAKLKRMKRMNANDNKDVAMEMAALATLNQLHSQGNNNEEEDEDDHKTSRVSFSAEAGERDSTKPRPSLLSRLRRKSLYDSDDEV